MLHHGLGRGAHLANCSITSLDSQVRLDGNFHLCCWLDIVPLIDVSPYVTFHGDDTAVTDIFARLGLAKIVPWNCDAHPLAKAWEGQKQECAVVAASVVGPEECFGKLWLQAFQGQEGVLDYGCNGKPVLCAFLEEVDKGPRLSKKKAPQSEPAGSIDAQPIDYTHVIRMSSRRATLT